MSRSFYTLPIFILLLATCRKEDILILDQSTLSDIHQKLEIQRKFSQNSQVFIWDIFKESLTNNEKQALEFLYANMPACDLADYPGSFFLANVRQSLRAREDYSWCRSLPENIFLHYVLPVRVNNEALDTFRVCMYDEIRNRIKHMNAAEAALEINHWCHEKVAYHPTDSRTSAPLATMEKTFGRCGEESVFTIAALRTAGIPARQVYVPRWAHVDDNHAWVEVWIKGEWHYMGACEPEPALDMGWFSEPSGRAMMVHSYVFGGSPEPEELISISSGYAEINLTHRYAPVKKITVAISDSSGNCMRNARVEFGLYNYAEFYPIATKYTDMEGMASVSTGFGDLLIWVSAGQFVDYRLVSITSTDTVKFVMNMRNIPDHTELHDLDIPRGKKIKSQVSLKQQHDNAGRIATENARRNASMARFNHTGDMDMLSQKTGLDRDTLAYFLSKTYGNWKQIEAFIEKNAGRDTLLLPFLNQLSEKDFSDAQESMLTDFLIHRPPMGELNPEMYERFVLSPRIGNENLSAWRSFLMKKMAGLSEKGQVKVEVLLNWIENNISLTGSAMNYPEIAISPIGVYNLRAADRVSRDIFFVACCRTFGIPSKIDAVTGCPEYFEDATWQKAFSGNSPATETGTLHFKEVKNPFDPEYHIHFTLSKFEDGHYRTLEFPWNMRLSEFSSDITLETGRYMLVTGNRRNDGSVWNSMTFFTISKGKNTDLPVFIRLIPDMKNPIGKINLDQLVLYIPGLAEPQKLISLSAGKKLIILLLDPDQESSKHALNEVEAYADHFKNWDGKFILAMPRNKSTIISVLKPYHLPGENVQGIDTDGNICKAVEKIYGDKLAERLPVVALCDQDGMVYLLTVGYKIGIGEQLLKFTRL